MTGTSTGSGRRADVAMTSASRVNKRLLLVGIALAVALSGCKGKDAEAPKSEVPRFSDGLVRFDRAPGEKGYWDSPSETSLMEDGVQVEADARGKLKNLADADKIAPFQPWALALFKYRQE